MTCKSTNVYTIKDRIRPIALASLAALMACSCAPGPGVSHVSLLKERSTPTMPSPISAPLDGADLGDSDDGVIVTQVDAAPVLGWLDPTSCIGCTVDDVPFDGVIVTAADTTATPVDDAPVLPVLGDVFVTVGAPLDGADITATLVDDAPVFPTNRTYHTLVLPVLGGVIVTAPPPKASVGVNEVPTVLAPLDGADITATLN